MKGESLPRLADEQLTVARKAGNGRAAVTVFGGREHDLEALSDAVVLLTVASRAL